MEWKIVIPVHPSCTTVPTHLSSPTNKTTHNYPSISSHQASASHGFVITMGSDTIMHHSDKCSIDNIGE